MRVTTLSTVITAFLTISPGAGAFWGGPGSSDWFEDFMGGGFCNFSFKSGARSRGRERGYGYRYGPYPGTRGTPYGQFPSPYGVFPGSRTPLDAGDTAGSRF